MNSNSDLSNINAALYRMGGLSALLLFLCYVLIIVVFVIAGAGPENTEEFLLYMADNTISWWTILGLSVLTDFLFLPISVSLYIELKHVDRITTIAGIVCLLCFVFLDLAITWPTYGALIDLSEKYMASVSEAQRAPIIAAATYALSMLHSGFLGVYIILIPGLGFLMIGLIMMRSNFGKATAYLAIISGLLAVISVVGGFYSDQLGNIAVILSSTLITFWSLLVGIRLLKLSSKQSSNFEAGP